MTIHQDLDLHAALLDPGETVVHEPRAERRVWLQMARGAATVAGTRLAAGDGFTWLSRAPMQIHADEPAELLLFDMG